jgi:menaquinone-specific isochorismate synthase
MMRFYVHDDTETPSAAEIPHMSSVAVPFNRPVALTDFLRAADSPIWVHWQHNGLPVAYAGYGAAAIIDATDTTDRFEDIRQQAAQVYDNLDINVPDKALEPRFFGGFSFQNERLSHPWQSFNPAWFVLPRVMLTEIEGQQWLTLTDDLPSAELHAEALALVACFEAYRPAQSQTLALLHTDYPLDLPTWRRQINTALGRINEGVLEKVVLSRTCDLHFDAQIDPLAVLDRLAIRYPDTYRFMVSPATGVAFVGATPEVLVEVEGSHLRTAAVAGSIGRGRTPQEDAELAAQLFTNPKERHEHALVSENLRDLLEPLTRELRVPEEPHILTLGNIQHLHTPFVGTLTHKTDVLDVVRKLHPTPALGGCPQQVAMDTIQEIETISRGWYASPVGWFDRHGGGLFAVAIRSAVINGSSARLYAGCGIVGQSDPDREWQETAIKFKPMLDALGATNPS